jgi:diketogulonate reductase-like aldo/keto reductase
MRLSGDLTTAVLLAAAAPAGFGPSGPSVLLSGSNAAVPGVEMPVMGLGTGGYNINDVKPLGAYTECWSDGKPDAGGDSYGVDCSAIVLNATLTWLQEGGRRIDSSDDYNNMRVVGQALAASPSIARGDVFITGKVGNRMAMGASEVRQQVDASLAQYNTSYIDLVLMCAAASRPWPGRPRAVELFQRRSCVRPSPRRLATTTALWHPLPFLPQPCCARSCLVAHTLPAAPRRSHWPMAPKRSTDPECTSGNDTACRLSTYRALLDLMREGKLRAVGVSNYNVSHLAEIEAAGLPMPAVEQVRRTAARPLPKAADAAAPDARGACVRFARPRRHETELAHYPSPPPPLPLLQRVTACIM